MKRLVLVTMALLFVFSTFSAQAFDDFRRGFILGIGVGKHESDITTRNNIAISESMLSEEGLTTSIRIGGGVSDHLLMYWFGDESHHKEVNRITSETNDVAIGFTGLGMSLYFTPRSHSVYFNGAVGIAGSFEDDADFGDNYIGTGTTLGVGLELGARISVELNHTRLNLEHEDNDTGFDMEREIDMTRVLLVYTWY